MSIIGRDHVYGYWRIKVRGLEIRFFRRRRGETGWDRTIALRWQLSGWHKTIGVELMWFAIILFLRIEP